MTEILQKQISLQQISSNTYSASWHHDWVVGKTLNGGHLASVFMHAARRHLSTDPTLAARDQPDVLSLHIEFLHACEVKDTRITITTLRTGSSTSTLLLELSQDSGTPGKSRPNAIAIANSTNFDKTLGPSAPTDWTLHPPPKPIPNFALVEAHKPEPNWIPATVSGELLPFTRRSLCLNPRGGFPTAGVYDAWNSFRDGERMDATYFGLLSDFIPAVCDSLMGEGMYNAHAFYEKMEQWDKEHPGIPTPLTNTIAEAMKATRFSQTVTLNLEFRRRVPAEGLRWVFTRTETKMMEGGRMGVDITLCDENMNLVCEAHQLILALDAQRKFLSRKSKPSSL
ncbi:unnamed protein product [Clonostachys rosea f. rosea IK726]|uniref:Uncharacterized protein n=1 Tax=Clonostachys rosea f. rosea IK726 TaxID=1349383 RepID=A0ACA9TVF3_BIOOC|nr:unnamed protein product [Clonostachys rosea f. rosea IK726]